MNRNVASLLRSDHAFEDTTGFRYLSLLSEPREAAFSCFKQQELISVPVILGSGVVLHYELSRNRNDCAFASVLPPAVKDDAVWVSINSGVIHRNDKLIATDARSGRPQRDGDAREFRWEFFTGPDQDPRSRPGFALKAGNAERWSPRAIFT